MPTRQWRDTKQSGHSEVRAELYFPFTLLLPQKCTFRGAGMRMQCWNSSSETQKCFNDCNKSQRNEVSHSKICH